MEQRPLGAVAVEEHGVAVAGEQGREDVGLAVDGVGDVADQSGVADGVDRIAVVVGALARR